MPYLPAYIYHKHHPNVGRYTIHGPYGNVHTILHTCVASRKRTINKSETQRIVGTFLQSGKRRVTVELSFLKMLKGIS